MGGILPRLPLRNARMSVPPTLEDCAQHEVSDSDSDLGRTKRRSSRSRALTPERRKKRRKTSRKQFKLRSITEESSAHGLSAVCVICQGMSRSRQLVTHPILDQQVCSICHRICLLFDGVQQGDLESVDDAIEFEGKLNDALTELYGEMYILPYDDVESAD